MRIRLEWHDASASLILLSKLRCRSPHQASLRLGHWAKSPASISHLLVIELFEDGSYTISKESGTYQVVAQRWLVLSSKKGGRARLDGTKAIIFEFESGGKNKRITYRRKFEAPPGWLSA